MTAEQLEELASGANPAFMGLDYDEVVTGLARRVLAAEKLVEQLDELSLPYKEQRDALTAYREASK